MLNQSYLNKYISQTAEDDQESFVEDYISKNFLANLQTYFDDAQFKENLKDMQDRITLVE